MCNGCDKCVGPCEYKATINFCPVCNGELTREQIQDDVYMIACHNQGCPVNPHVFGSTRHNASIDWDIQAQDLIRLIEAIQLGEFDVNPMKEL